MLLLINSISLLLIINQTNDPVWFHASAVSLMPALLLGNAAHFKALGEYFCWRYISFCFWIIQAPPFTSLSGGRKEARWETVLNADLEARFNWFSRRRLCFSSHKGTTVSTRIAPAMLIPGKGLNVSPAGLSWGKILKHGRKTQQRRRVPRSSYGEKAESGLCWAGCWSRRHEQRWGAAHHGVWNNQAGQHTEQAQVQHLSCAETSQKKRILPKAAEFPLQCVGETKGMGVYLSRLCVSSGFLQFLAEYHHC